MIYFKNTVIVISVQNELRRKELSNLLCKRWFGNFCYLRDSRPLIGWKWRLQSLIAATPVGFKEGKYCDKPVLQEYFEYFWNWNFVEKLKFDNRSNCREELFVKIVIYDQDMGTHSSLYELLVSIRSKTKLGTIIVAILRN